MDFELTFSPELEQFRTEVAAWLDANNPGLVHSSDPSDFTPEDDEKRVAFRKALGEKGWLYPTGPAKYGGGGLSVDHAVVIAQELDKREIYGVGGGDSLPAACILVWGTEVQKHEFAEPILTGEKSSWLLLTEPQGGSDLASARTTAIKDGDDYIVNGQKIFVGNARVPEYMFTIVNTDPQGARHRNLSYLMIPTSLPGITIQPLYLLSSTTGTADRTSEANKNIVFFDDVRVSSSHLIGGHNEGWKVAATNMELEHGGGGNIQSDLNLQRLIQLAKEMQWDGRPLIADPETRGILAETIQVRDILRLYGLRSYYLRHSGTRMEHEGPQLSYYRKSRAHKFAQLTHDVLGHYSITRDPKYMVGDGYLELFQRAVFVTVHAGGGLNIQATVVARRLGIGRNTREEAGALPGQSTE